MAEEGNDDKVVTGSIADMFNKDDANDKDEKPEVTTDPDDDDAKLSEKTLSQKDLDRILTKRLKRQEEQIRKEFADYDTLKTEASEYKKLKDEKSTDFERWEKERTALLSERDSAKSELTKLQRANLVADLASDKGLPKALWKRVAGETSEEIEEDIESIINDLGLNKDPEDGKSKDTPTKKTPTKKGPLYGGGGEQDDPEPDIAKMVAGIPRGPQIRIDRSR